MNTGKPLSRATIWFALCVTTLIGLAIMVLLPRGFSPPLVAETGRQQARSSMDVPGLRNPVIGSYLRQLTVLEPHIHEGLSIYPLIAKSTFDLDRCLTLDQALKRGALHVTELGEEGQVNVVLVENTSDNYIFIMSGEILKGAKQDRTVQNDLLIPPHSGKIRVRVFCTEHGRWVKMSESFEPAEYAVPNTVRQVARVSKDQGSVWSSIAASQSRLQVAAPTGAAREVYDDKRVQQSIAPYITSLADVPDVHPRVVGVAAAFGRRIIAIDIFGTTELFRSLYPKLLRSYAVDVIGSAWSGETSVKEITALLNRAVSAQWRQAQTDGVGAALEFHELTLDGFALLYKEMLIHCDLFVTNTPPIKPLMEKDHPQESPTPDLDFRRRQHLR